MATLYTISTLPATSQEAIREFDDRYLALTGAAPPSTWTDIGDTIETTSPMVTFPVTSFGLKYQLSMGENRFRMPSEKSFDVKVAEFDEGYEGKLLDILAQVWAYRNWLSGPERLMYAEQRLHCLQLVTLIEAGVSTYYYGGQAEDQRIDGQKFFSATHLSNFADSGSTTWSNYESSAKDVVSVANIAAQVTIMQGVLDENGQKIGADPDTILVPTAKYEPLKNLLAKELILDADGDAATNNPYKGRFNVIHVPEFTDANDWYLVDSKLMARLGLPPWFRLRYMTPTNSALALRYFDESSDFFKNTGRIKASSHVWNGYSLGFPHAIRKVVGA